ncbi:hypothetical protein [Aquibium microcysteis]|uniref:hypothetical protein n=1 Tax=Aquibium microcysteis TaxID=675281 RepID=UPI00165D2A88|nr:hypothetical protein [Aquibium microcysteis]
MSDAGTLLILVVGGVLGIVVLFWLTLFMGLAVLGIILEVLFLPFRILLVVGAVFGALASGIGRFFSRRRLRSIARGPEAPPLASGGSSRPVLPTQPRPGHPDYLAWANREGRFSD